MGINQKIVALRRDLVDAVNGSGLPACICSLVISQVFAEVQALAKNDLECECEAEKEKEKADGGQSL